MDKKERFDRYKYTMGLNAWEIASFKDPNMKIVVNDGPCGLRKPIKQGFNDQNETIVSVCLPSPSALAASFDEKVCYENGKLLSLECRRHGTNILLAPGVNIKHSTINGRNFEYFSEDPYLAGKLSASYINGLEENGVGACIKHYAANGQEHARLINSSEVSLRALNEIYLAPFRYALKYSNPISLMTSYNRVNGEYVNESEYLIQKKLRKEFGFKGIIMSDWGAVSNKGKTIRTGLNVEMPICNRSEEYTDKAFIEGVFSEEDLIARDEELYENILKFKNYQLLDDLSLDDLHDKAIDLAQKTLVLAKNENNYLPFDKKEKVLVLGYFASHPRYVGGGSGWVNAYNAPTYLDVLKKENIDFDFVELYDETKLLISKEELSKYAGKYDKVLFFMGQYQKDESEGSDRTSINFRLHQKVALTYIEQIFKDFATIVVTGSVMNIENEFNRSKALLINYLAGEGQSEAIFRNIYGINNPSGRLPETWVSSLEFSPIHKEVIRRNDYFTYYDDDIFVGYRYYDLNPAGFILPFGYGLSYSSFEYSSFKVEKDGKNIYVRGNVKNVSNFDGEEVVQVYIGKKDSKIYRPIKEFKAFKKIFIKGNESIEVCIPVEIENLVSYRDATDTLEIEKGTYEVYVGKNANEISYIASVELDGSEFEEIKEPIALTRKKVENKVNLDTPLGILFYNDVFKQFAKENDLPLDIDNFEEKYWYLDSRPIRNIVYDKNISFEILEKLINKLNEVELNVDKVINYDHFVMEQLIKIEKK